MSDLTTINKLNKVFDRKRRRRWGIDNSKGIPCHRHHPHKTDHSLERDKKNTRPIHLYFLQGRQGAGKAQKETVTGGTFALSLLYYVHIYFIPE